MPVTTPEFKSQFTKRKDCRHQFTNIELRIANDGTIKAPAEHILLCRSCSQRPPLPSTWWTTDTGSHLHTSLETVKYGGNPLTDQWS